MIWYSDPPRSSNMWQWWCRIDSSDISEGGLTSCHHFLHITVQQQVEQEQKGKLVLDVATVFYYVLLLLLLLVLLLLLILPLLLLCTSTTTAGCGPPIFHLPWSLISGPSHGLQLHIAPQKGQHRLLEDRETFSLKAKESSDGQIVGIKDISVTEEQITFLAPCCRQRLQKSRQTWPRFTGHDDKLWRQKSVATKCGITFVPFWSPCKWAGPTWFNYSGCRKFLNLFKINASCNISHIFFQISRFES